MLSCTYHRGVPISETIQPYYSFANSAGVPLYAGPLIYLPRRGSAAEQGDGTVSLWLAPAPRVLMRGTDKRAVRDVNDLLEGMESPQLPQMSAVPSAPEGLSETGSSAWLGPVGGYVVGKTAAARRVTFHLANFLPVVGWHITDGLNTWLGRITIGAGPWEITIDSRPDLAEVLSAAGERGGNAITHTCSLERRDGRSFAYARAQEVMTCLTWCLWFCRAAAPSVLVPVGFDSDGRALWSRWAAPHTDPLPDSHRQWFDTARGAEQLSELFPLFWQRYNDPVWRQSLQLAVRYYSGAVTPETLQRSVILAQVGLEALAYTHLVEATQKLKRKHFKHPISNHIRQLLIDFKIPRSIPRNSYGLKDVRASKPWDGPAAVAWLRNDIVHGPNHKVHADRWRTWYQGWQLAVWYLELAVLAVVGYEGSYRNRFSDELLPGAVEPVPWTIKRSDRK